MDVCSSPEDYHYLFIDMNAFFASCEQQANLSLRGKPVGVAPYTGASGCVISASYEAKAFRVATGMRVAEARRLCPSIIIRESNVPLYLATHHRLVKLIESFTPFYTVKSVDEVSVWLPPHERNEVFTLSLAKQIKSALRRELGEYMRCSIGIGPNLFLAKLATDLQKPDGLVVIRLRELPRIYQEIKDLTDLPGINTRMAARLNRCLIDSVWQLAQASQGVLRRHLGILGEYWFLRLHGYDLDTAPPQKRQLGHQHVLEPKLRNWPMAKRVLTKLVEKAAARLRRAGYQAQGISLYLRSTDRSSWHSGRRTRPFNDTHRALKYIFSILAHSPIAAPPLLLAVAFFDLRPAWARQLSLLEKEQKIADLTQAIDRLNDRYGVGTVRFGYHIGIDQAAPDRIAFGRPS